MSYLGKSYDDIPVGGFIEVSNAVVIAGTPYLKADGSDVLATDYPKISGGLVPATSAEHRSLYGTAVAFRGVAYGNGKFIAIPDGPIATTARTTMVIQVSVDGKNWVQKKIPAQTSTYPTAIAFLNGQFVISTGAASTNSYVYTSPDGIEWTLRGTLSSVWSGDGGASYEYASNTHLSYCNGVYFAPLNLTNTLWGALVYIYTSTDAVTWSLRTTPSPYNVAVAYGAGLYVVVCSNGTTYSASDYTSTWTSRTNTGTGGGGWSCVVFGVGVSVNGGSGAFVSTQGFNSAGTSFGYSTNGTTWTQQTVPSGRYFRIVYANGLFVAVGASKCVTSPDGLVWTERTIGTGDWYDLTYSATYGFVAVTSSKVIAAQNKSVQSFDGITWNSCPIAGLTNYTDVCYGTTGGYMVLTDTGLTSISPDGDTWTAKTTAGAGVGTSIACNPTGTIYVAMNTVGAIYSSPDGTTWTSRYAGPGTTVATRVRWCNDKFIGLTQYAAQANGGGYAQMSKDGITWSIGNVALVGNASILTADGSGQSISMYYNDVTYGNGVYVIVGGDAYNSPGYGISAQETNMSAWSENGVVWQQTQNMPSKSIWSSVAFGNGVFVAISKRALFQVGTSYNILYNATNGNFNGFSINGETAGRLGREAAVSTNGVDWASSLLPFAGHWTSIVFNGHVFVALCSYSSSYAVSKDGFNWTIRSTGIQGFWNNACVGPSNTVFATSGIAGALPVPGGGIKITESATMVTLPYRKPQDGSNYVVKVK